MAREFDIEGFEEGFEFIHGGRLARGGTEARWDVRWGGQAWSGERGFLGRALHRDVLREFQGRNGIA